MKKEKWKEVRGYTHPYSISNLGRLRNDSTGRILNGSLNRYGYVQVCLTRKIPPPKTVKIHYLVARAFLGPRPAGLDINHLDGDKTNNRASNLEYCTRKKNMAHARRLGLWKPEESYLYWRKL